MKQTKQLLFTSFLLIVNFSLFANIEYNISAKTNKSYNISNIYLTKFQTVYICTGLYAYAYHSISNYPGLNNCKGEINYTDVSCPKIGLHKKV